MADLLQVTPQWYAEAITRYRQPISQRSGIVAPNASIQALDADHLQHCDQALANGLAAAQQVWNRIHTESQLTREAVFGIGRYILGFAAAITVLGSLFLSVYVLAITILLGSAAITGGALLLAPWLAAWKADRESLPYFHKALRVEIAWINKKRAALNQQLQVHPADPQLLAVQTHFNEVIEQSWEALASSHRAVTTQAPSQLTSDFYTTKIQQLLFSLTEQIELQEIPCSYILALQQEHALLSDELRRGLTRAQAIFTRKSEEFQWSRTLIAALFISIGILLVSMMLSIPIGMWYVLDPFLTLYWSCGIGAVLGMIIAYFATPYLSRYFVRSDANAFVAADFHPVLKAQLSWIKDKSVVVQSRIEGVRFQLEESPENRAILEMQLRQMEALGAYFTSILEKNKSIPDALGKIAELSETALQENVRAVVPLRGLDLAGREQNRRRTVNPRDLI